MKFIGPRMAIVICCGIVGCAQTESSPIDQDAEVRSSQEPRQPKVVDQQASAGTPDKPPKSTEAPPTQDAETAPTTDGDDTPRGATIEGLVTFDGDKGAIRRHQLDTRADPKCAESRGLIISEDLLLNKKTNPVTIRSAVVSITAGLGDRVYEPPTTLKYLTQLGCQNRPHVLALMAGQPLRIQNMDQATQSIRFNCTTNKPVEIEQAFTDITGGKTVTLVAEGPFAVTSETHPWILSYVWVFPHPYFDVTDHKGRFQLENVPPGEYTVEVWQESLGTQKRDVIVKEDTTVLRLDFTLSP